MASIRAARDPKTGAERPGVWEARIYLGRGRQMSRTLKGTKREVEKEARRLEVEHGGELGRLEADPTLADLLRRWLAHLEQRRSPTTLAGYRSKLEYLPTAMKAKRLSRLRTADLDELHDDLSARGLAPATVRQVHAIVRAALHQGQRWGAVTRNVAELASPPPVPQREQHPPEPDAVLRAAEAAAERSPAFATWLLLAAATGARRAELCGLQWADLDAVAGTLRIERTVQFMPGRGDQFHELPTKTRSARTVALDAGTLQLLAAHRARCEAEATDGHVRLGARAWMFSDEPGGTLPWRPDRVTLAWTRLRENHGLGSVRIHDLRHLHVTQLLAANVDLTTVASRVGHASSVTTQRVYAHQLRSSDEHAAEVIGRVLGR